MVRAYATYPRFIYPIKLDFNSSLSEQRQIDVAISEIKLRLLQEIINPKWEYGE